MARQTNPLNRGSAPDRARAPWQRPGNFKKGHKKRGGRKRGTPNRISADHKQAILEAMHRIGSDGNGKDGAVGYLKWVAERDETFFYLDLWSRLLELQYYDAAMHSDSTRHSTRLTITEAPPRHARRNKKTRFLDWLRQEDDAYETLVQDYMRMAVVAYKSFCKYWVAAFLTLPKNWRAKVAERQRHQNELHGSAIAVGQADPERSRNEELKFARFARYLNDKRRDEHLQVARIGARRAR